MSCILSIDPMCIFLPPRVAPLFCLHLVHLFAAIVFSTLCLNGRWNTHVVEAPKYIHTYIHTYTLLEIRVPSAPKKWFITVQKDAFSAFLAMHLAAASVLTDYQSCQVIKKGKK